MPLIALPPYRKLNDYETALRLAGADRADDVVVEAAELFHANDIEADDTSAVRLRTTGARGDLRKSTDPVALLGALGLAMLLLAGPRAR